MSDRPVPGSSTTGPNPGGIHDTESPSPGGAVTGEAGLGDAVAPDGDLGGTGDLGHDRGTGDPETDDADEREPQRAAADDAAIGDPEQEARRGRPSTSS